jgi:hypothetical protein
MAWNAPAAELAFTAHPIAANLKSGYHVVAADMNRDRRPDLIALASGIDELLWFENPGWQRHVIAGGFQRMINVAPWDTDGDGIPELVLAHQFANQAKNSVGIVSVLRHQGDPRQPWQVTEIDRLTTSHRLRWADVDGSGKPVCVNAPLTGAAAEAPDYKGRAPLVFYRPGDWKRQVIGEEDEGVVHGLYIADWDGDRRDEILTASFSGIHIYQPTKNGWSRKELARGNPSPCPKCGSSDIATGRLEREGFIAAIEPWHGNEVVVYRKGRQVIDSSIVDGHTVQTADLDGDGRDEVIASGRGGARSVYLYRLTGGKWQRQTLDEGGMGAASCVAVDLNADGKPDVACIGQATANLKWYENRTR